MLTYQKMSTRSVDMDPRRIRDHFHQYEINLISELTAEGHSIDDAFQLGHALIDMGFLEAPASTTHHLAIPGGLAEHSMNVGETLCDLVNKTQALVPRSACYIIGLLHDLCKLDIYDFDDTGELVWHPHTQSDAVEEFGAERADWIHGPLSRLRAKRLIETTPIACLNNDRGLKTRVLDAIEFHMGLYDPEMRINDPSDVDAVACASRLRYRFLKACDNDRLVQLTHLADLYATHVIEV